MTSREFLTRYRFDHRMVDGTYFPQEPLSLTQEDHLGVVLMNMGGPRSLKEVEPFLFHLFMDPAIIDIPLPAFLREPLCRIIAERRSRSVREEYALIGGASPINTHTERQAQLLEERLRELLPCAQTSVFLAMRYGTPSSEDAAKAIRAAGVSKLVLLPLYPQYSKTTSGASLVYWKALQETGAVPTLPTSVVFEYATHPGLVDAFCARIDQALETFDPSERAGVQLLFSAHGTPVYEKTRRGDPYHDLVLKTVEAVMRKRGHDRPHRLAFQSKVGPARWLEPSTPDALESMAQEGVRKVIVVPVAFVSDHVETVFELDMEVREEAEAAGIEHFVVTEGLNDHPRFIDALSDLVMGGRFTTDAVKV